MSTALKKPAHLPESPEVEKPEALPVKRTLTLLPTEPDVLDDKPRVIIQQRELKNEAFWSAVTFVYIAALVALVIYIEMKS